MVGFLYASFQQDLGATRWYSFSGTNNPIAPSADNNITTILSESCGVESFCQNVPNSQTLTRINPSSNDNCKKETILILDNARLNLIYRLALSLPPFPSDLRDAILNNSSFAIPDYFLQRDASYKLEFTVGVILVCVAFSLCLYLT